MPPPGQAMSRAARRKTSLSAPQPVRPALVVNRRFMQAFLATAPPCMALGMVEVQQQLCGMLALRLDEVIPAPVADRGFEFGHALFGNTTFAVLQLVVAFPGFQTYNVLINPNNLVVQAVLRTMLDDGEKMFHMCWALSDGSSKLIPIDEQPNHQIVHLFRLRKAQCAAH